MSPRKRKLRPSRAVVEAQAHEAALAVLHCDSKMMRFVAEGTVHHVGYRFLELIEQVETPKSYVSSNGQWSTEPEASK